MHEAAEAEMLSTAPGGAVEGAMIGETRWGAVRTLREQGWAKKAIARELGLDIKTVRSWLRRSWAPQRRRARGRPGGPALSRG